MLFLWAKIALTSNVTIDRLEILPGKIRLHIQDLCSITLEGEFSGVTEKNFHESLKRNNIAISEIIHAVDSYKNKEMCHFIYFDPSLKATNKKIQARFHVPDSVDIIEYSGEEAIIQQGKKIPFPISV